MQVTSIKQVEQIKLTEDDLTVIQNMIENKKKYGKNKDHRFTGLGRHGGQDYFINVANTKTYNVNMVKIQITTKEDQI